MSVSANWIQRLSVVNDEVPDEWNILAFSVDDVILLSTMSTVQDAVDLANEIKAHYKLNILIDVEDMGDFHEIGDNTCRVRNCIWCIQDACALIQRSDRLPKPQYDPSAETWTTENNHIARECSRYATKLGIA